MRREHYTQRSVEMWYMDDDAIRGEHRSARDGYKEDQRRDVCSPTLLEPDNRVI